jgi:hypothetical protein
MKRLSLPMLQWIPGTDAEPVDATAGPQPRTFPDIDLVPVSRSDQDG